MLYHVLMRFGKWEEILSLPFPQPPEQCLYATATLHFTRAIANASLGRVHDALAEEQLFLRACNNISPSAMFLFNSCQRILQVGREMLRGEITRSEELRVGKECVRQCRSRGAR